jgi:hypothetical protein
MTEATSRSYASACCIGRKPNVGSFVLGNNGGAWAESLAIRQLWQAEKKGSVEGEESVLLWPQRSSLSRTIPRCGPSENADERTDRVPAGLSMLFWLTNGSGSRFWTQKL